MTILIYEIFVKRGVILFRKREKPSNTMLLNEYRNQLSEKEILKIELEETKLALDAVYTILQNVTEPELIDSAIYELNSIQMKYSFLHRKFVELTA
jgi:hypothetical protein